MAASGSPVLLHSRHETEFLASLNDRFSAYITKIRSLREQSRSVENATIRAVTQNLENEIMDLKSMYERELEHMRDQLDRVTSERNAKDIEASTNGNLAADFQNQFNAESVNRRKLENALADAHRYLSEKDVVIHDLRIHIAQHQNALMEANKDRDTLHGNVTTLQNSYDAEAITRADLQAMVDKLTDQVNFERDMHEKDISDLQTRINAADAAIRMAEDRLKEHDIIDDQLANTLAKVKLQAHAEMVRFQEEAEHTYRQSLTAVKHQLDSESKSLAQANEENIHLKATIDDQTAKIGKLEGRCKSVEEQNSGLIQSMEVERTKAANTVRDLEAKLRSSQEKVNNKIRELNHAYNMSIPVDLEIEAFAGLLDAEEKRLMLEVQNPAPEIISRTMLSGRKTPRSTRPASRVAVASMPSTAAYKPVLNRTKSNPITLDPLPALNSATSTTTVGAIVATTPRAKVVPKRSPSFVHSS